MKSLVSISSERIARAAIGGVGGVVGLSALVVEFDEARILDAVGLGFGDRKDDALAEVFVRA